MGTSAAEIVRLVCAFHETLAGSWFLGIVNPQCSLVVPARYAASMEEQRGQTEYQGQERGRCRSEVSLAVRRHLGFFENHVTTEHGVVLLQFELALLLLLVLGGVVSETSSFTRNQSNVVTHSGGAGITVLPGVQPVLWKL